jgi:CcmD family protein
MMKRTSLRHYAGLLAIFAVLLCAAPALTASWQQPPPGQTDASREGYVPVKDLPPAEQLPAAPLVLGAYAVIWVGVLVYVWSISRRLGSVDRELATLRRMIDTRQ